MNAIGKLLFNLDSSSQQPAAGWSEVYPIQGSSYAFVDSVLAVIATARLALLGADCHLVGVLISDTDVKGDSYPSTYVTVPQNGGAGGITSEYELVIRFKLFSGFLKRSSRFLRAIPQAEIGAGGVYAPTAGFLTNMATYAAAVVANCSIATRIHGAVSPPFYSYNHVTAMQVVRFETKKIGRPFFLRRGRALIA